MARTLAATGLGECLAEAEVGEVVDRGALDDGLDSVLDPAPFQTRVSPLLLFPYHGPIMSADSGMCPARTPELNGEM